jgi:hypothetical protein
VHASRLSFFSDCVLSGIIAVATLIVVPQLHKKKDFKNIFLTLFYQNDAKGFSLGYQLVKNEIS